MYQSLTIIGRLGKDPEMKVMPSGDSVTSFSVATDRQWKGQDGQKMKETTWFRISVFGAQAEACNTYLAQGKLVLVEGRLQVDPKTGGPRIYTRQDGMPGTGFEIRASQVKFLSAKDEISSGPTTAPKSDSDDSLEEGAIPF